MAKTKAPAATAIRRVACYIRVSTDIQARKGDSLSEQQDTLHQYIDRHDDLLLFDDYIDDGISGQKLNRGDFTRLMDDVKGGKIDLIVFTKLDRWFRSLRHYLNTQATLEKMGVAWLAVSQPFYDTTTPQGRAFVAQSMTFAELEAQNDSVRIKDVFRYKYMQGEVLTGRQPWGFSIENKHLIANDDAPKVLDVFRFFDLHQSLNATITYMEQTYGYFMQPHNLKRHILSNRKYIGEFRENKNYCPAIIPTDLFESVQRKLQYNIRSTSKRDYVFTSLLRCACCGQRFGGYRATHHAKRSYGTYHYAYSQYRCRGAYPSHHCTNRKVVNERTLEKYLLARIKPEIERHIVEYEIAQRPAADNRQRRAALEKKIDRLKDLYVNELITLDEFKADKVEYTRQLAALDATNDAPEKDLSALRDFLTLDIESIYGTLDPLDKRFLWSSIIKEIKINERKEYEIVFL